MNFGTQCCGIFPLNCNDRYKNMMCMCTYTHREYEMVFVLGCEKLKFLALTWISTGFFLNYLYSSLSRSYTRETHRDMHHPAFTYSWICFYAFKPQ